jgi:hypothetical protein
LTWGRRSRKTKVMTARARALAALGAYLCLLGQVVGLAHVLLVRHATCPSHGELVHGGPPPAEVAPLADDTSVRSTAPESEELDEHCLFLATRRREMAGLVPARTISIQPAGMVRLESPPAIPVLTTRALFLVAPKTSPPIAA